MRKGSAILVLIILVSSLGIGIFLFTKYKNWSPLHNEPIPTFDMINDKHSDGGKSEDAQPKGWIKYTNSIYAYEFYYHPDFVTPESGRFPSPPPPAGYYLARRDATSWCDISIQSRKDKDAFEGEIENLLVSENNINEYSTVAGIEATKITNSAGDAVNISYYFKNDPFYYRFGVNYKKDSAQAKFCKDNFEKTVSTIKLLNPADFFETGNLASQNENGWALVYDLPGNPAANVSLVFNDVSMCNTGSGYSTCNPKKLSVGSRTEVWGYRNNYTVTVTKLLTISE